MDNKIDNFVLGNSVPDMNVESPTQSSVTSFNITETESTVCDYDPDYIKKAVAAYERSLERKREYRQRKQAEMTPEQKEEQLKKGREYAKKYRALRRARLGESPTYRAKKKEMKMAAGNSLF